MTEISSVSLDTVLDDLREVLNHEGFPEQGWVFPSLEEVAEDLFCIGCSEETDDEKKEKIFALRGYVVQIINCIKNTSIVIERGFSMRDVDNFDGGMMVATSRRSRANIPNYLVSTSINLIKQLSR